MSKSKKKQPKTAHELLSGESHRVYLQLMQTRYDIGHLVTMLRELHLNTCADIEFRGAFIELTNARHSLKVLLEHPVFLGALADVNLSTLTAGDKKT
jgi:hypothetical protein